MKIPTFLSLFSRFRRGLACSELDWKGERVLSFDTYANCERAKITAAKQSAITKGFKIVKGKYGTKIVRVNLSNSYKRIYACVNIGG